MPGPNRHHEPNFFIIGAPKCGTTALHEYLAAHPQIFMTGLKEPHHFSTDLPGRNSFFEREHYLELFAGATAEHLVRGESSVYYLFSHVAISNILKRYPDARLVVMLRNPVDLVYSLHGQLQTNLNENVADFSTAWRLQDERLLGRHLPPKCVEPRHLQYREVALLGQQMQRALTTAPAGQLHTIFYDDFCRDPARIYAEVLAYLGLPHDGRTEFPRINVARVMRYKWFRHLIDERRVPEWFRRFGRRVGLQRIHKSLKTWNENPRQRPVLDRPLREELIATFRDDVGLLSELTHRDLSHWLAA